ncbi:MAG: hypothetical protein ACPHCN_13495 [Mycobacterium sp.]
MEDSTDLSQRLTAALEEILPVQHEDDGALTVHHDDTFASLRVVTIAEDLDLVSLTQVLAWDLPLDSKIRAKVAKHAHDTLLGTVSLVEKVGPERIDPEKTGTKKSPSAKAADVLLRYNFPAAGLTDDALRTLVLMVLATGADVRRGLVGRQP